MTARAREPQRESGAEWLESQLQEARARLHKVEGELSQSLKHLWALDADVKKMREAASASAPVGGIVQGLREEIRQLRDQVSRLQDRQTAVTDKVEQLARARPGDGRDGQELGSLAKQADAMSRALEQQGLRLQALEEMGRKLDEETAGTRLTNQAVDRAMAELSARVTRAHESAMRVEQHVAGSALEMEKLRNEDEALADRVKLLLEGVRRTAERLEKLESASSFPEAIRELVQTADYEREQLAQRVAGLEHDAQELVEQTKETLQGVARLDQRTMQHTGELLSLTRQIEDLGQQVSASLKKVYQVLLRQRRRQAETLNQEIKELSQGEFQSRE